MDGFVRFLGEEETAVIAPEMAELKRLLAGANEAGEAYQIARRALEDQNVRLMRIGALVCGFDESLMLDAEKMVVKRRPEEQEEDGSDSR